MSELRNSTRVPVAPSGYARACLQKTVATVCAAHGWQSATREALHVLTLLFEKRLMQLARATLAVASNADYDEVSVLDAKYALDHHGVTLKELAEYASIFSKPAVAYPGEQLQFPAATLSNLHFDPSLMEQHDQEAANGSYYARLSDADYTLLERAFPHFEPHFPAIASVPNWKTLALSRIRRCEQEEAHREGEESGRPEQELKSADSERLKEEAGVQDDANHLNQSEDTCGLQPAAHAFEEGDVDELERLGALLDAEHASRFSNVFALFGGSARRRDRRRFDAPPNGHPQPIYSGNCGTQPRSPVKTLLFPFRKGRHASESESEADKKRSKRRSVSSTSSNEHRRRRHAHRRRQSRSRRHDSHSRRHRHRHRHRERDREPEEDPGANGNAENVILPRLKLKLCDPNGEDRFQIVEASSHLQADTKAASMDVDVPPLGNSNVPLQAPLSVTSINVRSAFENAERRLSEAIAAASPAAIASSKLDEVVSPVSSSHARKSGNSKSRKKPVQTAAVDVRAPVSTPMEVEQTPQWNEPIAPSRSSSQVLLGDNMDTAKQAEPAAQTDAAPKLKLKFKLGPPPKTDSMESPVLASSNSSLPTPFGADSLSSSQPRNSENPFLASWSGSARLFGPIDSPQPGGKPIVPSMLEPQSSPLGLAPQLNFFQAASTHSRGVLPTMVRPPEGSELAKMYSASSARASSPSRHSPHVNHSLDSAQFANESQNQPINLSMKPTNGKRRSDLQPKAAVSLTPIMSKGKKSKKAKSPEQSLADEPLPSSQSSAFKSAAGSDSRKQASGNQPSSSFVTMTAPPTVWNDTLALPAIPNASPSVSSNVHGPESSSKAQTSASSSNKKRPAGGKTTGKSGSTAAPHQTVPAAFSLQEQPTALGSIPKSTRLVVDDGEVAETDAEGKIWLCPQCSAPDDGTPMVCCDGCNYWFHFACVGLQNEPSDNEQWFCAPCSAKNRYSGKRPAKSAKQTSGSRKAKRK